MDTGTIIAIVVGAIVLIALLVLVSRAARNRKLEAHRTEAAELRTKAEQRRVRAERHGAVAEEKSAIADRAEAEAREAAAVAKRERAEAQERAAFAEREGRTAQEHQERASELDPDADDNGKDERWARNEETADTQRRS
ncbi:MAG: hypothetical protein ACJ762_14230 [Solirubrobacteraceae bacterium]